jgi:DNA-binding LacI/PurR family transcriptional regulator
MTLKDVALKASVSTATVSRVLNKTGIVREATRRRVLKAASELKYFPNLHARSLAGAQSKTIGMIVSNIENPFFLDIFCGLEAIATQHGYEVVVEHTRYLPSRLQANIHSMLGRRIAGLAVIVSEMNDPSLIGELSESRFPVVFLDATQPEHEFTNIKIRYEKGMRRIVEYLYSLGHRRMAFVGHHASLGPLQVRQRTFLGTLKRYSDVQSKIVLGADSPEGGRRAMRELLDSDFDPAAIVCVNDIMAMGVLRELRDRGRRVPEDISVTGFDNIELSRLTCPSLTTLEIPRAYIGQMVFKALTQNPPELETSNEILIDPELVVRESTGPARKPSTDS